MTVAHLNWAYLKAPWGDHSVAEFTDNVPRVNATADRSPGFIARPDLSERQILRHLMSLVRDFGTAPPHPDRFATTLSVWQDVDSFRHFVTRTVHGRFMARRAEWFIPQGIPAYVIWLVEDGHIPGLAEARERMDTLIANGPSEQAFDLGWHHRQVA